MARPLRIEYAGAWYHIMNRGAGRRAIFPSDRLRARFLELLEDIHERYRVETHAWCLMDNHYHLLVRTPQPNLGRAMRHVDGVYTQRHNRHLTTDGPLFRGRYRAIVVDSDAYLVQLSRYIHCNPIAAGVVGRAESWRWSSYRGYLDPAHSTNWLYTDEVLSLFGKRNPRRHYRTFVERGVDAELCAFYEQASVPPVLGSPAFREGLAARIHACDRTEVPDLGRLLYRPSMRLIAQETAAAFNTHIDEILTPSPGQVNVPRAIAMSLCQSPGGYSLKAIAAAFGLRSYSGVATSIARLRKKLKEPQLHTRVKCLKARLF